MTRFTWMVCVLVLLAAVSACGDGSGEGNGPEASATPETGGTPTPIVEETVGLTSGDPANFHERQDVSGETALPLELDDNFFKPTIITGTAGQQINLALFNGGGNIHNLSIPELGIDQDLTIGATQPVMVAFPESGALQFFCKYHLELGMRGELLVP